MALKKSEFLATFNPYETPSSVLARLNAHFQSLVEETLNPLELIVPEWRILMSLALFGPSTINELVDFSRLPQSTVSRSVARLESKGFVKKKAHPKDQRIILVRITRLGMEKTERAARSIDRLGSECLLMLQEKLEDVDIISWLQTTKRIKDVFERTSPRNNPNI